MWGHQIATNFCTYHNNTTVMSCAKYGSDHLIRFWITTFLPLVLCTLQNECIFLFLQLWSFTSHHDTQQLILQTFRRDHEVEQCHLHCRLRQVVRVTQLGGDVEAEVVGVLYGAVTQLDADGATLFEGLLQQQRLQDRVQLLIDILQQNLWGLKIESVFMKIASNVSQKVWCSCVEPESNWKCASDLIPMTQTMVTDNHDTISMA